MQKVIGYKGMLAVRTVTTLRQGCSQGAVCSAAIPSTGRFGLSPLAFLDTAKIGWALPSPSVLKMEKLRLSASGLAIPTTKLASGWANHICDEGAV